ncbi:hypothetical protein EW145_g384 [Phellinidium pouzarii]|uniref:RING-type E3 ubiquitin transferase n=1 Tax=Phellinidium pouzarii TaxID=167371 RepID=A0A4S4LIS0_9AGAM|nr:hypothetical protein EW145_g384 [Phellinidium pouzarii]
MATQVAQSQPQNSGRRTNRQRNRSKKNINGPLSPVEPQSVVDVTAAAETEKANAQVVAAVEQEDEADVCWICAEPVKFYSLSECNHRTCHVCALRLRALYKKLECTFCKHPQAVVIFTTSPTTQFDEFKQDVMNFKDAKLSIVFETQEMMEDTLILLRFNCPDEECAFIAKGWNDLKVHARAMHGKVLCDICIRFKKVFAHEHTLYTPAQFQVHMPSLSQRSNKLTNKDKDKVEGGIHPLCEFCRECFFGTDEIFSHMRERHEECFICKRQEIRDQYFLDYNSLEHHFTNAHHPCTQLSCLAQKFVVFGSPIDLKGHMVEVHGANLSTKDMKDVRRVDAHFDFDHAAGGRRRDRDRDRGHDPGRNQERDPSPAPNSQQRPSGRRREVFGAALTSEESPGLSRTHTPTLHQGNGRSSPLPAGDADPETARRHAAFMARVANLTSGSPSAATSVRSAIRSFRASESAARDLVSVFYSIVDRDLEATASLIAPLLDLLDDEDKKKELLQTFNGFKVEQRQQFPDLVAGGQESAYSGVASGRVLNVKHSTQPRRSTGQVWDRVARAATSSQSVPGAADASTQHSGRFPALQRVASSVLPSAAPAPAFRQAQHSTPWASSSAAPAPTPTPRIYSQTKTSSSSKSTANLSKSAFPSLPAAAPRVKPVMSGNQSLRNVIGKQGPAATAWGSNGNTEVSASAVEPEEPSDEVPLHAKKGKKKGKEKVTLFTMGAFPT